ncbi:hypothetical protein Tco_0771179 [Tanacetum coccineum]|uniref:Uncharacterized protein n=1 Tax=Tanacetum coccineum TaxID=301880 RepID=A0ABQ4ZE90_9ASTR
MHGHDHPKLAKKLNDKIPKTVDEMFARVRAFIRGEVVVGSAEMVRPSQGDKGYVHPTWTGRPKRARNRGGPREARRNMRVYTPYPKKDIFTLLTKIPKEILAIESISFPEPPPLIGTPKKQIKLVEMGPSGELDGMPTLSDGRDTTKTVETNLSPPDHPKDKSSSDASAKLTRAKLNKRSREADLSKDKSGPKPPPEFQRSWCVEEQVRSRVIRSVLAQRYLRTIRQRYSPSEGPLSLE